MFFITSAKTGKNISILLLILLIQGCATLSTLRNEITGEQFDDPVIEQATYLNKEENRLLPPYGGPIPVAVYSFQDKTGQRKSIPNVASFSSAVTQGAENYLIKALQDVGDARWFKVVERVGLENLIKERQMIKQTREIYEGTNAKMLPPMTLAGVILEGGIVDYNTNVLTGGTGFAVLGIGPYTQYTQDQVVISLRLVSVQNGEILTSVTIEKNLLSTGEGTSVMRFFNQNTKTFEFDTSQTFNEPGNYALRSAIEQGIVELVKKGEQLGLWKYKEKSEDSNKQ